MKKAITKTDGQLSHIAKGLLKHEISEANQNPAAYAEAMGWDNVEKYNSLKGHLSFNQKDVDALVKIMMQNNMKMMPTIDIMEHGKINDFLTNFIAKKLKK
mgnify:CR=1 FL=1